MGSAPAQDGEAGSRRTFRPGHTEPPRVGVVASWLAEMARVPAGLALAYLPGTAGVNARTREQLIVAVSEVNGCRYSAWVHGAWLDFLGRREPDEFLEPLLDYARSSAEHGRPLDPTTLYAVYPPALVASVRAVVARSELADIAGNSLDGLLDVGLGRLPLSPAAVTRRAAAVAAALPLSAPMVIAGGVLGALERLAPRLPTVRTPGSDDTNLVVDMVAQAVPTYLGNTMLRTGLVWAPVTLSVAFRMEGKAATLTVGRGDIRVEAGVQPEALVVVDGGLDALLRVVAGSLAGELTNPRPLRRRD